MGLIKKIKIRVRLIFLSLAILSIAIIMALYGLFNINALTNTVEYTYNYTTLPLAYTGNAVGGFNLTQFYLFELAYFSSDEDKHTYKERLDNAFAAYTENINNYKKVIDNPDYIVDKEEVNNVNILLDNMSKLNDIVGRCSELGSNNRTKDAINIIKNELSPLSNSTIKPALASLTALNEKTSATALENSKTTRDTAIGLLITIFSVCFLIGFALAYLIIKSITRPVFEMVDIADNLSKGNLNVNIRYRSTDEIGVLADRFRTVISTLSNIIGDIQKMSREQSNGNTDYFIEASKYEGGYYEVAEGVNDMAKMQLQETNTIINSLYSFGNGDFEVQINKFPGKKVIINQSIEELRNNLKSISYDISKLSNSVLHGDLEISIDANKYAGDWQKLGNGLNKLIDSVAQPIIETSRVLSEVSKGNLNISMQGNYEGQFLQLKNSLNDTITQLNDYISEISRILTELSHDNYDLYLTKDFHGDFIPIKTGLNHIIERINIVMSEINNSADQVAAGSRLISESSMNLSQGATEQAASVEELNSSIEMISEQTRDSAVTARDAYKLAESAQSNATKGNNLMENMLFAMEEINDASNNISKIIKVIEEIALQTNLLALNAAVEAARAGHHGRGFAVVADQVRTLAGRSQDAVKETTSLIEGTVDKVGEGTKMANETADSLKGIVDDVANIHTLINKIAESATDQDERIGQIRIGISQISEVTQSNTATSEETAASAEELSSQAETFKNMVNNFNLRKNANF